VIDIDPTATARVTSSYPSSAANSSDASPSSGTDTTEADADLRTALLTQALAYVPDYGWSDEALLKALADNGLSASSFGLFPNGAGDLVEHFVATANAATINQIQVCLHTLLQKKGISCYEVVLSRFMFV